MMPSSRIGFGASHVGHRSPSSSSRSPQQVTSRSSPSDSQSEPISSRMSWSISLSFLWDDVAEGCEPLVEAHGEDLVDPARIKPVLDLVVLLPDRQQPLTGGAEGTELGT